MNHPTIAIIANGQPLPAEKLRLRTAGCDLIIATDGAARICFSANIRPDYIIGDFDSITPDLREFFKQSVLLERQNQDFTDLQKSVNFALQQQPEHLIILSPFGKRTDHALANVLFLQEYAKKTKLEIFDPYGKMCFLPAGRHEILATPGQTVSFLALQAVKNLHLSGFRYTLSIGELPWFAGVSNVVEKEKSLVAFDKGQLIMYEVNNDA